MAERGGPHVAPTTTRALPAEPLPGSPVARLRPRTAPQILDAGFEVLRFRARTILLMLVALHGPFYAAAFVMYRQSDTTFYELARHHLSDMDRLSVVPSDAAWLAGSLACTLFGEMLFSVALGTLVRRWLEGAEAEPLPLLKATLRRFPAILGVWLMALVLKALGAALCGVGLLLVVPYLSILAPVVAFERGGPAHWLGRSRDLVKRSASRALFLTLMAPALSVLVSLGLDAGDALSITRFEQYATVMGITASLLLLVARSAAMTLFYLDIRVRTEGLDLAIRAGSALGEAP